MRIEPAPSEAVAAAHSPAATAAALPPLEPPGVRSVFQGLRVTPKAGPSVSPMIASSGRLVLPRIDRAGGAQPADELVVALGRAAVAPRCPSVVDLAGHVLGVLDRDRHAEQRPLVAGAAARVGLAGVERGRARPMTVRKAFSSGSSRSIRSR